MLGVLLGAVKNEHEFWGAAELEPFTELVADEAGGRGEGFDGGLLFILGAHDADVNFGLLQVRRHAHFGDGGEVGEARVFEFAGEHGADFLEDFSGDAFAAMSCDGHIPPQHARLFLSLEFLALERRAPGTPALFPGITAAVKFSLVSSAIATCREIFRFAQDENERHRGFLDVTAYPHHSQERSQHFQVVVDEVSSQQILGLRENGLKRLLEVRGVIRKTNDADLSALPSVLVIEFGDGHVEPRAKAVFQAAQDLAFIFKRMCLRDIYFQG